MRRQVSSVLLIEIVVTPKIINEYMEIADAAGAKDVMKFHVGSYAPEYVLSLLESRVYTTSRHEMLKHKCALKPVVSNGS